MSLFSSKNIFDDMGTPQQLFSDISPANLILGEEQDGVSIMGKDLSLLASDDYWSPASLSTYYTGDLRFNCRFKKGKSILEEMKNPRSKINTIAKKYDLSKGQDIRDFIDDIYINASGADYICADFNPRFVVTFIEYFAGDLDHVTYLDMSSGWGDRMIGSAVWANIYKKNLTYLGTDPNTALFDSYGKIIQDMRKWTRNKWNGFVAGWGGEDIPWQEADIAFTSPPYWSYEKYSDETSQSMNMWQDYRSWRDNWYTVYLHKMIDAVKNGGKIGIHVEDLRKFSLKTDTIDIMVNTGKVRYIGTIPVRRNIDKYGVSVVVFVKEDQGIRNFMREAFAEWLGNRAVNLYGSDNTEIAHSLVGWPKSTAGQKISSYYLPTEVYDIMCQLITEEYEGFNGIFWLSGANNYLIRALTQMLPDALIYIRDDIIVPQVRRVFFSAKRPSGSNVIVL
jgi:hypothetical protein